jgi:DNA-binding transcriptional MerR regulator
VNGQRRYATDTLYVVAVLQLAKKCGFSLVEMRRLMSGFDPETPASQRWRVSIAEHQRVIEQQIAQLNAMRRLLRRVRECKCADLVECGRIAAAKSAL